MTGWEPAPVLNPALGALSGPNDLNFLLLRTDLDTQFTLNAAYLVFFMQVRHVCCLGSKLTVGTCSCFPCLSAHESRSVDIVA